MRIVGPNCLGIMNPLNGFNGTFGPVARPPGNVAFISQSGALWPPILDWSLREMVGFSAFASIGSMLDVGWGDLIDYLGDDPNTKSIVIYMETIGDARSFLSAAREVALEQTDHRHQARPQQGSRAGGGLPYRVSDGQRTTSWMRRSAAPASCASTASPIFSTCRKSSASSRAPKDRA